MDEDASTAGTERRGPTQERPRLAEPDASKPVGAPATGTSRPTNTERERVNKLIEERRKVHTALEKDTVDSILEQAAAVAETERQLDGKSGSINKLLKLLSKDRMWFKRLRDVGQFEPFQQIGPDKRKHLPPSLSTLAELTRVGETNWPDVAGIIKPKMTRNEVKDAIKDHIPPPNQPKPRRSKKPEEKRDELVDQLIKLLNAHTALIDGAKETLEDFWGGM